MVFLTFLILPVGINLLFTSRYFSAFIERFIYFNLKTPKLKKVTTNDLKNLTAEILNEQK